MKTENLKYNVICWNVNSNEMEWYDVVPYFVKEYKESKSKPKTMAEFKEFVEKCSMYQFWSRCEYEVVVTDWPAGRGEKKLDVHEQVMANIDIVTEIVKKAVGNDIKKRKNN